MFVCTCCCVLFFRRVLQRDEHRHTLNHNRTLRNINLVLKHINPITRMTRFGYSKIGYRLGCHTGITPILQSETSSRTFSGHFTSGRSNTTPFLLITSPSFFTCLLLKIITIENGCTRQVIRSTMSRITTKGKTFQAVRRGAYGVPGPFPPRCDVFVDGRLCTCGCSSVKCSSVRWG